MIRRLPCTLFACGSLCFAAPDSPTDTPPPADAGAPRHGTITEKTPSIPQYFTWINNTNEGATEEQTLVNLRFFYGWTVDRCPAAGGILPRSRFRVSPAEPSSNFTYFFPVTQEMHGRNIEVVVLGLEGCAPALKPEVWTTTSPHPYESLEIVLE